MTPSETKQQERSSREAEVMNKLNNSEGMQLNGLEIRTKSGCADQGTSDN